MSDEEGATARLGERLSVASIPRHRLPGKALAALAFTALGVVYGDIGTSPLYAMQGVLQRTS